MTHPLCGVSENYLRTSRSWPYIFRVFLSGMFFKRYGYASFQHFRSSFIARVRTSKNRFSLKCVEEKCLGVMGWIAERRFTEKYYHNIFIIYWIWDILTGLPVLKIITRNELLDNFIPCCKINWKMGVIMLVKNKICSEEQ